VVFVAFIIIEYHRLLAKIKKKHKVMKISYLFNAFIDVSDTSMLKRLVRHPLY